MTEQTSSANNQGTDVQANTEPSRTLAQKDASTTQEEANQLSYRDRYQNYKAWFSAKEKDRQRLRPWQYSTHIQPMSYGKWLKQSSTESIPADCRAGQGKEPWQK